MYRTAYKTLYRVHTLEEALTYEIPKDRTDLFLYLIDVYDVLLSVASNELPMPNRTQILQMRNKFSSYILSHYHKMYTPIPGALLGWTESMLMWVILLSIIDIQHWGSTMELSPHIRKYVKKHAIRMFEDHDLTTWNLDTVVSQLDCLCLKWHELEPCDELEEFLEILWRFAARFTLRIHSKDVINLESYTEDIPKMVKVRMTPDGIMVFLSRFYWFHHMIFLRKKWETIENYDVYPFPKIEDTNWDLWILNERRHFVTRRFRDGICSWMWDKLILFGDQEIASHDQLGDEVSAFTCMYARFPAGLVSLWQRILTYKEYKEIIECKALKNFCHLHMIQAHFSSVYNVSFLKYFFIYDKCMNKHIGAISKASTPLVVYWYNKYVCYYKGKVYQHPQGTDMKYAFTMWCYILRKECGGKCYDSMDFNVVCEQMLDQAEVVNNDRVVEGFFTLEDV